MKTNSSRMFLAIATATLALVATDVIAFGVHPGGLAWRFVLANLLTATTLAYVVWAARGSEARDRTLFVAVFLLYYGITYVNSLDEGVLFLGLATSLVIGALVMGLVRSMAVAGALVLLSGRNANDSQQSRVESPEVKSVESPEIKSAQPSTFNSRLSTGSWLWRLIAGDFAYVFLYFAAGLTVFPFVKEFYASMVLPKPSSIILMQLLRGMIYIVVAMPAVRLIRNRRHAALALGLAFSILGGVAPLLPDNPLMPPNIRFAHTIEIAVSNFIYGVVLAYLFTPQPASKTVTKEEWQVASGKAQDS
jgi:hypothetical protein